MAKEKVKPYINVYAGTNQALEDGLNIAAAKGYVFKHLLQPRQDLFLAVMEHESVRPVIKLAEVQDEPALKAPRATIDLTPDAPASE